MSAEAQLEKLAAGPGWVNPLLARRSADTGNYMRDLRKALGEVKQNWESLASDAAQGHIGALVETFSNAREWLTELQGIVKYANTDVQEQARFELSQLPPASLPQRVLDAIARGDGSVMTDVGVVALSGIAAPVAINMISMSYASERERKAVAALKRVERAAGTIGEDYSAKIAVGFDIVKPKPVPDPDPIPDPNQNWPQGGMGTGIGVGTAGGIGGGVGGGAFGRPPVSGGPNGPGSPGGPGHPGGPEYPDGPGNPDVPDGADGGNDGPDGNDDGERPDGGGDTPPGGGSDPGNEGGGDGTTPDRPGPAVDSGLGGGQTGFGLRSGLGAAGLGAAGLAAGAKLASGGAGGLGGLGAGVGGLGGVGVAGAGTAGLAGTTGAGSGAGGANSGAGAAKSAGAGAGKPGMMMGGQGGGGADKKGGANRLGYVAPKFEDDFEESMPHPASRAGKRGE